MAITLFLCGDVMTGRGVDQILAHPSQPDLAESYIENARDYVELAERQSGAVPRNVGPEYIWGDALGELERIGPAARVINLETSVTTSSTPLPGKDIHYRMHPHNVACLSAAHIDVCALANNHVLDFGAAGLSETMATLERAGIGCAGAGRNRAEAERPVLVNTPGGRVVVFSLGSPTSGVLESWAASEEGPGVDLLPELSVRAADRIAARVLAVKRPGDIVVVSIHWGANWGYEVSREEVGFAHRLIERGVDMVHGHSSHHPRPIEVYDSKLILYGCGDFIDDYEGITGYEAYRDDLVLMFFAAVEPKDGRLVSLRMTPMQIRKLRLNTPPSSDVAWLGARVGDICRAFGTAIAHADGAFALRW